MQNKYINLLLLSGMLWCGSRIALAQGQADTTAAPSKSSSDSGSQTVVSPEYILRPGDVVSIKVYQEDDLTSTSRISKDGAITMPLLGSVKVVNRSLQQATLMIQEQLGKRFLVNPQVTMNVSEFAKRRFTVLGQVQKPGTYDMPPDDAVSLLQAIATAGGYTRIANSHKIIVQRTVGAENKTLKLDADALASDRRQAPFEILPDDVITVGEKWL